MAPTNKNDPALRKISDNMRTVENLVKDKVLTTRAEHLEKMLEAIGDRIALVPSSTRTEYQGCYPGGMIDHSLKVLKLMVELNNAYKANQPGESMVVVSLFHELGKVGTLEEDLFLPKNSDWHNKQGIMYEYNPKLYQMTVATRSLFLLQHFGVVLTPDEFYAISSVRDRFRPGEESLPVSGEPILAVMLQQAVRVASLRGGGKTSILD